MSGGEDKTVKVWETSSGREIRTLGKCDCRIDCIALANGNRIVISGYSNKIRVWDMATGREVLTLGGNGLGIRRVAYRQDGKKIVSAAGDGIIKVWDAASGVTILTLKGHADSVWDVALSPDGKRIVSAGFDNTVRLWDAANGKECNPAWKTFRPSGLVRCFQSRRHADRGGW